MTNGLFDFRPFEFKKFKRLKWLDFEHGIHSNLPKNFSLFSLVLFYQWFISTSLQEKTNFAYYFYEYL